MKQKSKKFILWFKELSKRDVALVGGKNASLGEMFSKLKAKSEVRRASLAQAERRARDERSSATFSRLSRSFGKRKINQINIPDGFALTTKAYWYFLKENNLDERLKETFAKFNPNSIKNLQETGRATRNFVLKGKFPEDLKKEIIKACQKLEQEYGKNCALAVRSSGVAEDAPRDSFAGQFETYLNVKGEEKLLAAIKKCFASSFGDRVIAYRQEKKIPHLKFALSVGIQKMVRSDLASSGVMFTLDTETGFPDVVLINSIFGVGEMIVQGKVTPDEFYIHKPTLKKGYQSIILKNLGRKTKKYIFAREGGLREAGVPKKAQLKFSLTDEEILTLARWALIIEEHYQVPQDIEWAKDGKTGQLFIVQSRPETVHTQKKLFFYEEYEIKERKKPVLTGIAIGNKIGQGRVRIISDVSKISEFQKGEVLVTKMTDPDWLPAMRIASAIVTNEGGKTAHAAIVARELGIPAIVGAKDATKVLKTGEMVTVDCTQGLNGRIFEERISYEVERYDLEKIPKLKTKIMINIGAPDIAFKTSFLPNDGVGLAREEFIIAEKIRVHPLALYHYKNLKNKRIKREIEKITIEHKDKREYFIKELAEGIAQIAAAFWPKPVIVRLSDLKTNEYRALIGGELFEPEEANPMLGWRGASRHYDEKFRPAFEMECQAIKRAREVFGLKNIWLMVPFCRTPEEGKKVLDLMAKNGLKKGENGLRVIVMCEVPSNVILAEKFLEIFDGMSIGSNDLTQLVLGLDRDNAKISYIGNEQNEAVKEMISKVIKLCREKKKYCGICGDAPSSYVEFAKFLMDCGIPSMSLSPDAVMETILNLSKKKNGG